MTQELQPILGFNVIETLVNKGVDNKALYTCVSDVSVDRIESVVNLLQADTNPTLSKVSILKQGMSIKSGEIAKVPVKINVVLVEVKINVVLVEDRTPVLFEPRLEHAFENITICSNIIFLKEGVSSRTHITIINNGCKDIKLPGHMIIGELNLVKNVTPVDIELKQLAIPITNNNNSKTITIILVRTITIIIIIKTMIMILTKRKLLKIIIKIKIMIMILTKVKLLKIILNITMLITIIINI